VNKITETNFQNSDNSYSNDNKELNPFGLDPGLIDESFSESLLDRIFPRQIFMAT
jgi:hypothetical protein